LKLDGARISQWAAEVEDADDLIPAHGALTASRWPLGVRRYFVVVRELYAARLKAGGTLPDDEEWMFAEQLEGEWELLSEAEQQHVERLIEEVKQGKRCLRCGRLPASAQEDCRLGAEVPGAGTEPHLFWRE
jgi:hypothetical protein